jgi:ribonuclease P protein component
MSAVPKLIRTQTFHKAERLTSRKIFERLMQDGKSVTESPFRIIWKLEVLDSAYPAQAAFAVPKKLFSSAVDRNRIKRMMREVYRKNKAAIYPLLKEKEKQLALLLIYSGKSIPLYAETEKKINLILQRLAKVL